MRCELLIPYGWYEALKLMDPGKRGELLLYLLDVNWALSEEKKLPELPEQFESERMAVALMIEMVKTRYENYKGTCEKNRANGKKGGRPKKHHLETAELPEDTAIDF